MSNKKFYKNVNLLFSISCITILSSISMCSAIRSTTSTIYEKNIQVDKKQSNSIKNKYQTFNDKNSISIPASSIMSGAKSGYILCTFDDTTSPKTCTIDSYDEDSDELFVASNPSFYNEISYNGNLYSLTSIGMSAFDYCISLTGTLTLPSSITSIDDRAFQGCNGLKKVQLSNNISSIPNNCFSECICLTSINLENITLIGGGAFSNTDISNLNFGQNLSSIENTAFENCPISYISLNPSNSYFSLLNTNNNKGHILVNGPTRDWDSTNFVSCMVYGDIDLPSYTATNIDKRFKNCGGLTSIILPSSVTSIGGGAFIGCKKLFNIDLYNISSIGDDAFYGCNNLTSINFKNVTSIGEEAFDGCINLDNINLDNIESIQDYAFYDCYSLSNVNFGNKLVSIGADAFSDCQIKVIKLSQRLSSIGANAFMGCPIQQIDLNNNPNFSFAKNVGPAKILIKNNRNLDWDYETKPIGNLAFGEIDLNYMPSNFNTLVAYLFYGCNITFCIIPSYIDVLYYDVFENCYNLKQINLNWTKDQIENHLIHAYRLEEDEDDSWLGDWTYGVTVVVPKGLKNIYEKHKIELGIKNCYITDVKPNSSNNSLALSLGLGLGIGIPVSTAIICWTVAIVKKPRIKKSNKK